LKASKKKSSSYQNKITCEQFQFLLQNEVKVYPISIGGSKKWKIQVSIYGKLKTFSKELMDYEIQEAIDKTMLW
jgi:carbon monoxide dehydrogenase subunit G